MPSRLAAGKWRSRPGDDCFKEQVAVPSAFQAGFSRRPASCCGRRRLRRRLRVRHLLCIGLRPMHTRLLDAPRTRAGSSRLFGTAQSFEGSGRKGRVMDMVTTDTACRGTPRHDEHSANSRVRHDEEHVSGNPLPRCAWLSPCSSEEHGDVDDVTGVTSSTHVTESYGSTSEQSGNLPLRRAKAGFRGMAGCSGGREGGTVTVVYPGGMVPGYPGYHGTPPLPTLVAIYWGARYLLFGRTGSFLWAL